MADLFESLLWDEDEDESFAEDEDESFAEDEESFFSACSSAEKFFRP